MKFTASIVSLKAALLKAKTTIAAKDIKPVLKNFLFELQNGTLRIMASDLDLSTVCEIKVTEHSPGSITVPGQKFYAIVENSSSDTLNFTLEGSLSLIETGSYSAHLQCLPVDDFPEVELFNCKNPFSIPRQSFVDSINRISFSISDNEARKNLMAVYINGGFIQATDGHVSSVISFSDTINDVLIPSLAVPDLIRVLRASDSSDLLIAASDSFLMFRVNDDTFSCRLSQAKFPDIVGRVLVPTKKNPISVVFNKEELTKSVNRIAITASQSSFSINYKISGGKAKVSSSDADGNFSSEELSVKHSDDIDFDINFIYLLDICKSIEAAEVEFKMAPNLRVPIRIDNGNFTALLMRLVKSSNVPDARTAAATA